MSTVLHLLRRAGRNLIATPILTLTSILIVAVSLFVVATFGVVLLNLRAISGQLGQDVVVTAWVAQGVTPQEIGTLRDEIAAYREVEAVAVVDQEEAKRRFTEAFSGVAGLLDDVGENPLPASLEITLRPGLATPQIEGVVNQLRRPAFEDIDYGQEWAERFAAFLELLRLTFTALGGVIVAASVVLIANTIHLIIYSRRDELEILRLVGATGGFLRLPFVIEGAVQGLVGGGIALALAALAHSVAAPRVAQWMHLLVGPHDLLFLPVSWRLGLVGAGVGLAVAGNLLSVQRFLKAEAEPGVV